jgi:hypothetical protein
MLCYICYVRLCYFMVCYVMLSYVTLCYIILFMLRFVTLAMLHYVVFVDLLR